MDFVPGKLPEFEYVDRKILDSSPENCRTDNASSSFLLRFKVWLFWVLLIFPFRLFHVFFWIFFYALWYRLVIYPLRHKCGRVGYYLGTFLDFLMKKVYVPFFAWWMLFQYGIYDQTVHVVPMKLFQHIQSQVRGEDEDENEDEATTTTPPTITMDEKGPYVVVANHVSYVDGYMIFRMFGEVGMIAKAGIRNDLIVGPLVEELGGLYTDDGDVGAEIQRRAKLWENGDVAMRRLLVFPEATTENGNYLLGFHRGAFLSKEPVKMVMLKYQFERFDPAWITGESTLWYFETLHTQVIQRVHVLVFPAYVPSRAERENVKLYAENCRRVMARVHNEMLSGKFGFQDVVLSNKVFVRHVRKKEEVEEKDGEEEEEEGEEEEEDATDGAVTVEKTTRD